MPPFNHFTTKAKEVIRKAHELAIERGQNHVNTLHLLTAPFDSRGLAYHFHFRQDGN